MREKTVFAIILIVTISFVENVASECVKQNFRVYCSDIDNLSQTYFNQTVGMLQDVTFLDISNNDKPLTMENDAFEAWKNLNTILITYANMPTLYSRSFSNLPNVRLIHLDNDNIKDVCYDAFMNLSNVINLYLHQNELGDIKKGTFNNLPRLKSLDLSDNRLTVFEDDALENLPSLIKLKLNGNDIVSIFVHKIITFPGRLEILWLHNNAITIVSNFMLEKLGNLRVLNLGFNKLSVIEEGAFAQTPKLTTLVLTNNNLRTITGNEFPRTGMDYLDKLYLDHNRLMYLTTRFFVRLGSLKWITLMGNPWWCCCLQEIYKIMSENDVVERCHGLFVKGDIPVCVNGNNIVCNYVYDDHFSDKFIKYAKNNSVMTRAIKCIL